MPREPGTKEASSASLSESRETDRLKAEIVSLKGQLRQVAPPRETLFVKYETVDAEEAARYQRAGGRVVSVLKRFPDHVDSHGNVIPSMRPGRKIGFAETKEELEKLMKDAKEAGIL